MLCQEAEAGLACPGIMGLLCARCAVMQAGIAPAETTLLLPQ